MEALWNVNQINQGDLITSNHGCGCSRRCNQMIHIWIIWSVDHITVAKETMDWMDWFSCAKQSDWINYGRNDGCSSVGKKQSNTSKSNTPKISSSYCSPVVKDTIPLYTAPWTPASTRLEARSQSLDVDHHAGFMIFDATSKGINPGSN